MTIKRTPEYKFKDQAPMFYNEAIKVLFSIEKKKDQ